jgi:hypothetical protein
VTTLLLLAGASRCARNGSPVGDIAQGLSADNGLPTNSLPTNCYLNGALIPTVTTYLKSDNIN